MYRGLQLAIAQAAWDAATERAARVAEQQAECNGLAAGWHIAAEIRTTERALFQAQEAAKELLQKLQRLEAAMQWIEDRARAGKLEIAPSVRGTGFEFGFWPQGRALVITGAPTLLDALEQVLRA